jgi:hypothetical protein
MMSGGFAFCGVFVAGQVGLDVVQGLEADGN